MSLPQRDALRHTFEESPTWNDGARAEILSAATASHVQIVKLPVYEGAGVREAWFVHPTDRIVSVYHLVEARCGPPPVRELKGRTAISAIPGVAIDSDRVPGGNASVLDSRQRAEAQCRIACWSVSLRRSKRGSPFSCRASPKPAAAPTGQG